MTIFFTFPDSSVFIGENYKKYVTFRKYFYQNWAFFAPPPQYNVNIEYIYVDTNQTNSTVYRIDVLSQLNEKSKKNYLINGTYANLSWILIMYANEITKSYQLNYDYYLRLNKNNGSFNDFNDKYRKYLNSIRAFKILKKHSILLAKNSKIPPNYLCYIKIGHIEIPKYKDRFKKNKLEKNELFSTDLFSIQ